jgi:hypothetical protein
MSLCHIVKSSPTRRQQVLAAKIYKKGVIAIVACSACARAQVLYVFSLSSSKCAECTRKRVLCDRSFSKADYNKLSKKKARLKTARQMALDRAQRESAEAVSLNRRIIVLYKAKRAIIAYKARSLEQLE